MFPFTHNTGNFSYNVKKGFSFPDNAIQKVDRELFLPSQIWENLPFFFNVITPLLNKLVSGAISKQR